MNTTLKFARMKKGITQKDLGEHVGISSKYVSDIESKNLKPSPSVMSKISKVLDVSVQELFFQEADDQ